MNVNLFSGEKSNNNTILQAQEALSSLKRQISSLDKVTNASNLYYSLQRNIESFENQLEGQMKDIKKTGTVTNDPNKLAELQVHSSMDIQKKNKLRSVSTRARDQYKSWRKSYVKRNMFREDKMVKNMGMMDNVLDPSTPGIKSMKEVEKERAFELQKLNPLSQYSIPLKPMLKEKHMNKLKNITVTGDIDTQLRGLRIRDLDGPPVTENSPDYRRQPKIASQKETNMRPTKRKYYKYYGRRHSGETKGMDNFRKTPYETHCSHETESKLPDVGVKFSTKKFINFENSEQPDLPPNMTLKRQHDRNYERMMDEHALHIFLVRYGKVIEETPEFVSFKRICELEWHRILPLIKMMEKNAKNLGIKLIKVNGGELYKLLFKPAITHRDLLSCFVPFDDNDTGYNVIDLWNKLKESSAIKIQKWIRMKLAQKMVNRIRVFIKYVKIIQNYYRLHLQHKNAKKKIIENNANRKKNFDALQEQLKQDWHHIKKTRRVEIHYNSQPGEELHKLTISKFEQKQSLQIGRLYRLMERNIDIIYISSKDLPIEIKKYYMKVLEFNGIHDPSSRISFLYPENASIFPDQFTAPSLIYYSPNILKSIIDIVDERPAMIVSGFPCTDDIRLAVHLGYPIQSGSPDINNHFSKCSTSYKIFDELGLPLAPTTAYLYKREEIVPALTKLITENMSIERWVFKIDNEHNGRGIAYFDVNSSQILVDIRKNYLNLNDDEVYIDIQAALTKTLAKYVKFAYSQLYLNWEDYLSEFTRNGGMIQAAPSSLSKNNCSPGINFCIEPDGSYKVLSTYDKISCYPFITCGYNFPQKTLPSLDIRCLIEKLVEKLYAKGVFGFINFDLIAFHDIFNSDSHMQFWVNSLKIYYCDINSLIEVSTQLQSSNRSNDYDPQKKLYSQSHMSNEDDRTVVSQNNPQKRVISLPFIMHKGLSNMHYKSFFHLTRLEGLCFDISEKTGVVFQLSDSLQSNVIGVMTINDDEEGCYNNLIKVLNFLKKQGGNLKEKYFKRNTDMRNDLIDIYDIFGRIKLDLKRIISKKSIPVKDLI